MSKIFYRFRTIDRLIGEHNELDRQTIYFASPEQLNDPMEGFRNIYWSGDFIVWKNLFRHYLMCLERICFLFMVSGEKHEILEDDIPIFAGDNGFITKQYKDIFKEISDDFFSNENIITLIKAISSRSTPIRRDELFIYLSSIHFIALETIFNKSENKVKFIYAQDVLNELLKNSGFNKLENIEEYEYKDVISSIFKKIWNEVVFIRSYNGFVNNYNKK